MYKIRFVGQRIENFYGSLRSIFLIKSTFNIIIRLPFLFPMQCVIVLRSNRVKAFPLKYFLLQFFYVILPLTFINPNPTKNI